MIIFIYKVFGLYLASDIELPAIAASAETDLGSDAADLSVYIRGLPKSCIASASKVGAFAEAMPGEALVTVPEVGRFLISDGCRIDVEPATGYDPQTMELFLLGNMLGLLLLQRGFLVMHGNVLARNGSAIMICGPSSSGKSTLSAALIKNNGFRLISDDLAVFDPQGELRAGPTELKLWQDVVKALDLPQEDLEPLHAQVEKYRWRPGLDTPVFEGCKLASIYILGSDNLVEHIEFSEVVGMAKLEPLRNQVYRKPFVEPLGLSKPHFIKLSQAFGAVPVIRVKRALVGLKPGALECFAGKLSADVVSRAGEL